MGEYMMGILGPAEPPTAVGPLADAELEHRLKRLAGIERKALALLLAHLGEFDRRRLHADRGHPSLFSYCMSVLGYSEQAAYKRIQAARAARAHPEVLQRLDAGEVTLTAIVILAPHFRADNVTGLLSAARGRRTREVEALAAALAPRPDSPDCLRALPSSLEPKTPPPVPHPASESVGQPHAASIDLGWGPAQNQASPQSTREAERSDPVPREQLKPLSPQRHLFRFSGSSGLRAKYERARELLDTARGGGSMEMVVEAGLDALLDKLAPERRIARRRARAALSDGDNTGAAGDEAAPRPASRRVSSGLRDAVWERDGGRCTFVGPDEARCPATAHLEIDHVRPFALGGASDEAGNLRLMCRAHNQLLARRAFGEAACSRLRNRVK